MFYTNVSIIFVPILTDDFAIFMTNIPVLDDLDNRRAHFCYEARLVIEHPQWQVTGRIERQIRY